jgi:molybdopterin adenylyltransferase
MNKKVKVLSVNISEKKGTIKIPVKSIQITELGVRDDAHSGPWNRQVSMLAVESIHKFEKEAKRKIGFGEFAENITTEGIELWKCQPLDRFTCGDIELEVTQIGKECHGNTCAIFKEVGNCVMPKEGIFCRVRKSGILHPGSELEYHPRICKILVITLSDRASRGEYEDKSGPRIRELSETFFSDNLLSCDIRIEVIPDDPDKLHSLIRQAISDNTDIIFTTGGTGIGPRDFTPDVIKPMLDKEIPGIMELIRMKYGNEKPNVLLSRSIAGVINKTLIYTFPGSVKAVNEYFQEISKTIKHSIYMLHELDKH